MLAGLELERAAYGLFGDDGIKVIGVALVAVLVVSAIVTFSAGIACSRRERRTRRGEIG